MKLPYNARAYIMLASYEIINKNVWESKQRYNGKKRHEFSCQPNTFKTGLTVDFGRIWILEKQVSGLLET